MIKAVDLRKGKTVLHDGELCIVQYAQHVAKGNKRSYMQTKLKNFKSGIISDVRFSVDDRLEVPYVEQKQYEYLYKDGDKFVVMDLESFDHDRRFGRRRRRCVDTLLPGREFRLELLTE